MSSNKRAAALRARALSLSLLSLPGAPSPALGGPLTIDCPRAIDVAEAPTSGHPAWETTIDKGKLDYFLETVRIYAGHPSGMANLTPARTVRVGGKIVSAWQLPADRSARYWVACVYGNSKTLLTRPLPDGLQRCRLTVKTFPGGARAGVDAFTCD